jgi:ketosteroid isomerase-like protein
MGSAAGRRHGPARAQDAVRWLASFAVGCLVLAACATSTIQPVISVPDDPEFRARLDMLARAFESKSTDKVLQFYAQDTYSVSFELPYAFDPTGEDHFRTLERFFAMLRSIHLEPAASAEVWTTEDRVWTTRSYKASGTLKNGDTFEFDGWHSAIWEKRNGTW